jgi:sulfur carrier protein ThiS
MNMLQSTIVVEHTILPGYERARFAAMPGETIANMLERSEWSFALPTICVLNGQPVLRGRWEETIILPSDSVTFVSKPWGGSSGAGSSGGGKSTGMIIGLVAMVALAAIAPWAGGLIAGGLGLVSGTAAFSLVSGLAAAAIGIGGSLLLSTFLKPDAGGNNENAKAESTSQLYSLSAAANTARPLQAVNISYGRMKIMGDYVTMPYSEYNGDQQILNVLFAVGAGKYDVEQVLMDDTILWDKVTGFNPAFSGVALEIYDPGAPVTLFPLNILQAAEVNNNQLPSWSGTEWVGGFIANAADVDANALSFDFAFPAGLFTVNTTSNQVDPRSVTIVAEGRRVDAAGTPLEAYVNLFTETYTYATRQPKRITRKVTGLPPARYEVRVRRNNVETSGNDGADAVVWTTLRVHIDGPSSFEDVTTVALRIVATAQVSGSSSRQFSAIATRYLNVWNGSTFALATTKNPVWAAYDIATNSVYGAGRAPSKIDIAKFITEATAAAARGEEFNYNFTAVTTYSRAFDIALKPSRIKHCWAGDVLTLVRDEWKPIPSMLLTDQQIVRGSLDIEYVFNDEDNADAVIGEFLNDVTWRPAEIQYPPNGVDFTAVNPTRIRIDGITDTELMFKEIAFYYRQANLRRIKVKLDTEHDGRILKFGSAIKVQSFLPKRWGQSGEVVSYNSGTKIITLDRDVTFSAGQHYLELRDKRGRYFGPVKVTDGGPDNTLLINAVDLALVESQCGMTIADALDRMDGAEPPAFAFGIESEISRHCIVLSGRPAGDIVTLNCVVDLEDVHSTDLDDIPDAPDGTPLFDPKTPVVGLLYAVFRQGVAEPILDVTWFPAPGALFYRCSVSYDGMNTWEQVYEGVDPKCSVTVLRVAELHVRVAGISDRHGPWSVFGPVEGPIIRIGPDTVDPRSLIRGLKDYVTREIKETTERVNKIAQLIANVTSEQDFANATEAVRNKATIALTVGDFAASITETQELVADLDSAFAAYQVEVSVQFGDIESSVTTNATAIATLDNEFAAIYTLTLDVNDYVSGFQSVNDGNFAAFTIIADVFRLAQPGVSGGAPVVPFQVGIVDGVAKLAMRGDMFIDGIITARMLQVASINTQHLSINSVDITKLIAGAASAANLYSGGAVSLTSAGPQFDVNTSGPFTTPDCKILVQFMAECDLGASSLIGAEGELPSTAQSLTYYVYVDGVLRETLTVTTQLIWVRQLSTGYFNQAKIPSTVVAMVLLAAGSHTVTVKASYVDGSSGPVAIFPSVTFSKMSVTELRKAA